MSALKNLENKEELNDLELAIWWVQDDGTKEAIALAESAAEYLARLESALADLQQFKDNAVNDYVKLQDFAQSLPRELRRKYFKPGGDLVDGVIALAAVTGETE